MLRPPCNDFAPDTLGDDPNVCTGCLHHKDDHMSAETLKLCRELARDSYGSDELQIDDNARVVRSEGSYAWVAAWVLIDTENL